MAQKKSPPPSTSSSKGRRPTATIDLKATEVENETGAKPAISGQADSIEKKTSPGGSPGNKTETNTKSGDKKRASGPPPKKPAAPPLGKTPEGEGIGMFSWHLISGAVGGALALLGAIIFQNAPSATDNAASQDPQLMTRIAALEQRLASLPPTSTLNTTAREMTELRAQLEKLEITNAELRARADYTDKALSAADGAKMPDQIKDRLRRLQETIAALASSAKNPGGSNVAEIASLVGRINDFETILDKKIASLHDEISAELKSGTGNNITSSDEFETLKTGYGKLEQKLASLKSGLALDLKKSDRKISEILATNSELQQRIKSVTETARALETGFQALKSDIDAKSKSLAKTDTVKADMDALRARLTTLDSKLDDLNRQEDEQRKNAANVLLSLELGNLKRAIDNGASYARELDEIQRLAGDTLDLSALERYKSSDVLTMSALQKSFRTVSHEILSSTSSDPNGSVFDRILANAKGIVRIRKIGEVTGDGTEAILARMETRLKIGDLDGVLTESKKLPETTHDTTSEWLEQVAARNTINHALILLEQRFKSSLKPITGGTAQ